MRTTQHLSERLGRHQPTPAPSTNTIRPRDALSNIQSGLPVCICSQQSRREQGSKAQQGSGSSGYGSLVQQLVPVPAGSASVQQPGCTWPRCVLPTVAHSTSSGGVRDVSTHALRRNGSSIGRINGFGGSSGGSSSSSSYGAGPAGSSGGSSSSSSGSSNGASGSGAGGAASGGAGRGRLQAGAAVAELQAAQAATVPVSPWPSQQQRQQQQAFIGGSTYSGAQLLQPGVTLPDQQQQQPQQPQWQDSWQQQQLDSWQQQDVHTLLPTQQQQQQQQVPRSRDQQLLFALQHAPNYHLLSALVSQHMASAFQPHHTAAAVLRLAQLVGESRARVQLQGLGPLNPGDDDGSSSDSGSASDSYDGYDQNWELDAPHLHGLSSSPAAAAASNAASSSSSTSSVDDDESSSSSSGSAEGSLNAPSYTYGSTTWQQQPQHRGPYSSSRLRGLSGLVPALVTPTSSSEQQQQQQLPPVLGSSSSDADDGADGADGKLLDSATMAARMAAVRQQRAEQAALVRGLNPLPWQQRQSALQAQQQAQQLQQQRQAQQEVCYDSLLAQLLVRVVQQSSSMSASSGLSVLRGLALLRLSSRRRVLAALLAGPLGGGGLSKLKPAGFVSVASRLCRLGHTPDQAWLHKYARQLQARWSALSGPQLASAVVSLDKLGFSSWPEGFGAALAAALAPQLGRMQAQQLLWAAQAVAAVGQQQQQYVPDEAWGEDLLLTLRPLLPSLSPYDLTALLAALAALQIRPGESWLRAFITACPGHCLRPTAAPDAQLLLPDTFPQLLSAIATLRLRPDASWLRQVFAASSPALAAMDPQHLAATAGAAAALGFTPPEPWVAALAAASMWKLGAATPEQLAGLAESLVRLRAYPGRAWLAQYAAATDAAMVWCSAEELARLVAAAAALKHSPAPGWLARVEAASHARLGALSPGGLAALAQAMRALAAQPSLSWMYAFVCAAYPRLDQFDGGQLNGLFEALPVLAGAGGGGLDGAAGGFWLDDLVQICCYELPARQAERAALAAASSGGASSSAAAVAAGAAGKPRRQKQKQPKLKQQKQKQPSGGKARKQQQRRAGATSRAAVAEAAAAPETS